MRSGASRALALGLLAAGAAAATGWGPRAPWLAVPAAAALVLVLPGLAAVELLFPPHTLDGVRRTLLTAALSLAAAVLTGLALVEAHVRLDRASWSLGLGAVAVGTALAALVRASTPRPVSFLPLRPARPARSRRVRVVLVLAAAGSAASLAGAVVVAARPVGAHHVQGYTLLALTPRAGGELTVNVTSAEIGPRDYRLLVRLGTERILLDRPLALSTGGSWTGTVAVPAGGGEATAALVLRQAKGDVVYRTVHVEVPGR